MARNEDSSLPLRHVFVTAKTGGGKSQAMRNVVVPRRGVRALFWDVDNDHYCTRFDNKGKFLKAVQAAVKSGKPFRLGWNGEDDQDTFTWFCEVVWRVLDGDFDTYIVLEELADLEMGQKTLPGLGKLQKRARKYGGIVVSNTQRVQEIPKSLITQAHKVYIGLQSAHDAKYIERVLGIPANQVEALKPLEFFTKNGETWEKVKIPYKAYGEKSRKRNQFA
ncbi:hypothetical protein [Alkalimarinus coralli]|uniref:hypothetical protein n=1 Tax=Alkalimarinus coralli TaxID=2935863 RepID=UPI00202B67C7|nr:hypothetical protein [Alkalimarinus coralli]